MIILRRFLHCMIFILSIGSTGLYAAEWGEEENRDLASQEIFIEFYSVDKILMIREYGLSSLLTDEEEIQTQVDQLQDLIINAGYCKKRFGLDRYVVAQEKLIHTFNGEVHGANTECILLTAEEMPESMISAFSSALKREVEVTGNPAEITLAFTARDSDFGLVDWNALRVQGAGNDRKHIVWKNGERSYDLLVRDKTRSLELFEKQSIYKYIPELPIMSPALSTDDIAELKESLL